MHHLQIQYIKLLMDDQLQLQREQKERNSTLYELRLDEALKVRNEIDQAEEDQLRLEKELLQLADLGFFGYSQPGGLTSLFYGYQSQTCLPRHDTGANRSEQG